MNRRIYILIIIVFACSFIAKAQYDKYPFSIKHYSFIDYNSNKLQYVEGSENMEVFYSKLADLLLKGQGQINIVQIGGSHIQADIFSSRLRDRFQSLSGGQNAGRGFVFPYKIAKTNNPTAYHFRYSGNWKTCKNTEKKKTCSLGLGGISAYTQNINSSLTLLIDKDKQDMYAFNKFKIFHDTDTSSFETDIDSSLIKSKIVNTIDGYTQYVLNEYVDSLDISFVKTDKRQSGFRLYGILLESDNSGIVLHNIGINGAAVPSFLRCNLFEQQLSVLKPDMVILGLGINDAYGFKFSQANYEQHYDSLVARILKASPSTAILYLTNNDSYIRHRYINRNGLKVEASLKKLARKQHAALWDMFEVMGGLNSVVLWQREGLAKRDKIHFTKEGYLLIGDLLFDAIMKSFGEYLEKSNISTNQMRDNNGNI